MTTLNVLPVARSWRVANGNRWRAEATCPVHEKKTTRFVETDEDTGAWIFDCRPTPDESDWHEFRAVPREGAELP